MHLALCNKVEKMSLSFFFKFIYFIEREKERVSKEGAEREGERESQAGSVLSVQSLVWGLNPRTVRS